MELFHLINSDYRRYRATGGSWWSTLFYTQGFWASCVYRVYRHVFTRVTFTTTRKACLLACSVLSKLAEIVTGICIPVTCDIGEGLYIGHFGGIFLPSRGRLGRNCSVSQGVTMGSVSSRHLLYF